MTRWNEPIQCAQALTIFDGADWKELVLSEGPSGQ